MTVQAHANDAHRKIWRNGRYGSVALVTGASDGIGREFSRELARLGFDLILVARRADRLEALADELRMAHQTTSVIIPADLARPEEVARVLSEVAGLDIGLFVAAAGFGTSGELIDQSVEAELEMIDVNCRAVVAMTHEMARKLALRGSGGIILFSSILAFQGVPRSANYAATKAFIQSLAEGLATELKPRGVDVIAAAPGPIASGFGPRAGMTMSLSEPPTAVARATLSALGRRRTVHPGRLSKFLGYSLATLPRWGRILVMTQIMRGMTEGSARGDSGHS